MLKLASRFGQDGGWLPSWGSWTTAFVQEGQSDLAPCGASNFLVADGDIVGPYFWSFFCNIRLAFRPYIFWVPLYFSLDPWNGHCWDICFFMGAFCIDIMMRPGGYLKKHGNILPQVNLLSCSQGQFLLSFSEIWCEQLKAQGQLGSQQLEQTWDLFQSKTGGFTHNMQQVL